MIRNALLSTAEAAAGNATPMISRRVTRMDQPLWRVNTARVSTCSVPGNMS